MDRKIPSAYGFSNIGLVPRVVSTLEHRSEADTSVELWGIKLQIPLVATPMPDVCNGLMAGTLAILGAMGIIHRFQTIEEEVQEYMITKVATSQALGGKDVNKNIGCAIGATGDYVKRFTRLYDAGCRIFVIDTANGANIQVQKALDTLQKIYAKYEKCYLIAGAIATKEGFKFLADCGADGVRVGIAGGSVCITRTETGIYYPMASSIIECAEERDKMKNPPILISDGGVSMPADLAKTLALGSDVVFGGSMFAGTKEAPGGLIKDKDGKLFKLYRGAASFGVQAEHSESEPAYNEGAETLVNYKSGGVEKVIERFKSGLRSSMSYLNARNLNEFRNNADFVYIS
jgi:IMP dehydrogenase